MGPEPRVFRRSTPRWAEALNLACLVTLILSPCWLCVGASAIGRRLEPLPFGRLALAGGVSCLPLIALVLYLYVAVNVRRRYGHCAVHADRAVFTLPLGRSRVELMLADVVAREPTEWGVVLRSRRHGRLQALTFPLLIPARGVTEQALVIQLLDAEEARRHRWDVQDAAPGG